MKKLFLVLCAALAVMMGGSTRANAQCAFPDGTVGLNFGLGLGHSNWNYHHGNGWGGEVFIPSFNFALDCGFLPNIINSNGCISGGGYASIGRGSEKYNGGKDIASQWRLGTRGALHYTWVSNLDTYAGVGLGVKHEKDIWKSDQGVKSDPAKDTRFDGFGFGGVRYLMGNVAVYSELETTGYVWFQIGLSIVL